MIKCWKGSNIIETVVIKGKWPLASVDNQTRDEVEGEKKNSQPHYSIDWHSDKANRPSVIQNHIIVKEARSDATKKGKKENFEI